MNASIRMDCANLGRITDSESSGRCTAMTRMTSLTTGVVIKKTGTTVEAAIIIGVASVAVTGTMMATTIDHRAGLISSKTLTGTSMKDRQAALEAVVAAGASGKITISVMLTLARNRTDLETLGTMILIGRIAVATSTMTLVIDSLSVSVVTNLIQVTVESAAIEGSTGLVTLATVSESVGTMAMTDVIDAAEVSNKGTV